MKELTIRHIPANGPRDARVSVSYRAHERAQPQTAPETPFHFGVSGPSDDGLLRLWLCFPSRPRSA